LFAEIILSCYFFIFRPFFDSCDGIYLNYNWNDEKLELSRRIAGSRKFDVYVGVDVFGRGCFGGGGVNTWQVVIVLYFSWLKNS